MNYKQMLDKFEYLEKQIEYLELQVLLLQQQHTHSIPPPQPQTTWQIPTNPQDAF